MDDVVCAECGAEPAEANLSQAELVAEGWDFAGEYGERCPECVGLETPMDGDAGLDAIAEALGAIKKEES
jgi:hypothetical protein